MTVRRNQRVYFKNSIGDGMYGNRFSVLVGSLLAILSGCSTTSKDISSTYVSPLQYSSYDCQQLAAESNRVHVRVSQVGGVIDDSARSGNMATTAAVILFWPAAFFTGTGNKEQQAELARLKGEQDAIQQAAVSRKCAGIVVEPNPSEVKK
jgi:hypothetical protein